MAADDPLTKYTELKNPNKPYRLETIDNPGTVLITKLLTVENFPT